MDTPHQHEQTEQQMATSPWTDVFQQAQANQATTATASADRRDEKPAQPTHDTDADRPTHDALSAIFNSL